MSVLVDAAMEVTRIISPLTGKIIDAMTKSSIAVDVASEKGASALQEEVNKQNIKMQFELQQARIAQELAIAHRIINAEFVEIEEFYDNSGSGQIGLRVEKDSAILGLGAEGKSITKRIYQFKGRQTPLNVEVASVVIQPEAERLTKEDSNGG